MPYFLPLGPDEKVCLTQMKDTEMFHQTSQISYSTFPNTILSEQTIDSWRIPNLECGCVEKHHVQKGLDTFIATHGVFKFRDLVLHQPERKEEACICD